MPRDKQKITKDLILLLPVTHELEFKQAMQTWWFNLRKNGGLRLTSSGYHTFVTLLNLEHYEITILDPMWLTQQNILKLDRKMQMPYYIHAAKGVPKKIVLFGSREAMMINLYGNLPQFLDNYQP